MKAKILAFEMLQLVPSSYREQREDAVVLEDGEWLDYRKRRRRSVLFASMPRVLSMKSNALYRRRTGNRTRPSMQANTRDPGPSAGLSSVLPQEEFTVAISSQCEFSLSSDGYALADKMVKAELEGFAKAVTERFGERTFLPLAAKDTNGEAFQRVTSGMNAAQNSEVQQAWNVMRTVQQLSAHERSVTALKQAETLRQTRSQGLTLK